VAEENQRRWISFEIKSLYYRLIAKNIFNVSVKRMQSKLVSYRGSETFPIIADSEMMEADEG
jgi:hypothetical protein